MYHTTGFTEDEIIELCALVYANEGNCDIDPWPASLGLYKSVVIALTYMRRNRVQQELAETYKTSQPTISRANSRITSRLAIVLAPFVPAAEDLNPDTQYIYDGTLLVVARAPGAVFGQAQNHWQERPGCVQPLRRARMDIRPGRRKPPRRTLHRRVISSCRVSRGKPDGRQRIRRQGDDHAHQEA
jgi:hypothetical protein